jgi:hypothetical protein
MKTKNENIVALPVVQSAQLRHPVSSRGAAIDFLVDTLRLQAGSVVFVKVIVSNRAGNKHSVRLYCLAPLGYAGALQYYDITRDCALILGEQINKATRGINVEGAESEACYGLVYRLGNEIFGQDDFWGGDKLLMRWMD